MTLVEEALLVLAAGDPLRIHRGDDPSTDLLLTGALLMDLTLQGRLRTQPCLRASQRRWWHWWERHLITLSIFLLVVAGFALLPVLHLWELATLLLPSAAIVALCGWGIGAWLTHRPLIVVKAGSTGDDLCDAALREIARHGGNAQRILTLPKLRVRTALRLEQAGALRSFRSSVPARAPRRRLVNRESRLWQATAARLHQALRYDNDPEPQAVALLLAVTLHDARTMLPLLAWEEYEQLQQQWLPKRVTVIRQTFGWESADTLLTIHALMQRRFAMSAGRP